ncbi:MAG: LLM class flavin-dependent oxidoreductase [Chloroflexi bacterium]|nr:LLM class flavin-dependent oxidoreductase [Chloroflexota bacterium]
MASLDFEIDPTGTIPAPTLPTLARQVEEAGFAGIWRGETNTRDPIALLAACAPLTERVTLGTAVLHLFARSPVAAGMVAATLNALTGGRFVLGLGVANPTLARWHGGSFARPLAMARDYLTIVRAVYAGARVDHAGSTFRAHEFRLGGSRPEQPLRILLAALGPRMSRLAGEQADGVMVNLGTPAAIRQIAAWMREGALAAGRDPSQLAVVVKVRVALSDDPAAARDALRPTVATYVRAPGYREHLVRSGFGEELARLEAAWEAGGFAAAVRAVDDGLLARLPVLAVRDPAEVPPQLAAYAAAGATHIILPLIPVGPNAAAEAHRFLAGWPRS